MQKGNKSSFLLKKILAPFRFVFRGIFLVLAKLFRPSARGKTRWIFFFIILLAFSASLIAWPNYLHTPQTFINTQFKKYKYLDQLTIALPNIPFLLGLDLQGGTHLVYRAQVDNIPEAEQDEALSGVRDVIERRVNAFGVSEPIIQTSRGREGWNVVVELAGVKDVNQAIQMIGETPVLEFKEQNIEERSLLPEQQKSLDEENQKTKESVKTILERIKNGETFEALAKEFSQEPSEKENGGYLGFVGARDQRYADLFTLAEKTNVGTFSQEPLQTSLGYSLIQLISKDESEKEVHANHILICYEGASSCTSTLKKEDAFKKIQDLKAEANPEIFSQLAKDNSTEPNAKESGGDLGWFPKGVMVAAFENTVFSQDTGTISEIIESPFGYHIIHKIEERPYIRYEIRRIFWKLKTKEDILPPAEPWKTTGLTGKELKRADVVFDPQTQEAQVSLEFNEDGTKLFAEITKRNVGKPVAIFLDGSPISVPVVNQEITSGDAVIQGGKFGFDAKEAKLLAQRLNAGALPVPVLLISQETIGASLGKDSVNKSMVAGMYGFLFIAIFMIFLYRLPGILAVLTLGLYTLIVVSLFKLFPVTLTLSGISGFILSLGIAVDANVLVFERLREELRNGKTLTGAINDAFRLAWPSIRDGNVSTLFTCLVLSTFGTSLIKGFAITLALGIGTSIFTAMVVTRILLRIVSPWIKNLWLYGVKNTL